MCPCPARRTQLRPEPSALHGGPRRARPRLAECSAPNGVGSNRSGAADWGRVVGRHSDEACWRLRGRSAEGRRWGPRTRRDDAVSWTARRAALQTRRRAGASQEPSLSAPLAAMATAAATATSTRSREVAIGVGNQISLGGHVRRPHSCGEAAARRVGGGHETARSVEASPGRVQHRRCAAGRGARVEKPAAARVAWCAELPVSPWRITVAYHRGVARRDVAAWPAMSRSALATPRPDSGSPPTSARSPSLAALSPQTPPHRPRFVAVRPRPTRVADRSGTHGSSLRRGRRCRRAPRRVSASLQVLVIVAYGDASVCT
jgi:hypothetical protein